MNPMPTKQFDESALLALFYDSAHYREQIQAPFLSDGFVCATETHRLIMIKPEICKGQYKPYNLHVLKVLNPHNIDITLTLAKLKKAVGRVSTEKEMKTVRPAIKCEDCDGDGEVEWSYEDKNGYTHEEYHTCPICNGSGNSSPAIEEPTGRMIPPQEAAIGIYEQVFNAYQVLALCNAMELLGIDKARYVASSPAGGNSFILTDEITVVLCPQISETEVWVNRKKK